MKTDSPADPGLIVLKNEGDFYAYIEDRMIREGFEVLNIAPCRSGKSGPGAAIGHGSPFFNSKKHAAKG